jgi:glycosyltransferase involved in cell wall biosynthesis
MTDDRPIIMVLLGAYWPGHEATGPNLSFRAMCEGLSDQFDFRIVARDRAFGAREPIVETGRWHDLGHALAWYLPVGVTGARGLGRLLRATPYAAVMMNGFFDKEFTIPALALRRIGAIPRRPTLLAPRGEFSGGALALKSGRKAIYRHVVRHLGLLRGVTLHATSEAEQADLKAAFPGQPIAMITNFRPLPPLPTPIARTPEAPVRLAFVGRISRVKGVDFALDALARTTQPVRYTIFGPISDTSYWRDCEARIRALPPHVEVVHHGEIANAEVCAALAEQDMMFLPSRSENFGHAIFESLAAGTPVLIGDKTPWRGLEAQRAGFDLALTDPERFAHAIDRFAAMPATKAAVWRAGARAVAERHVAKSSARTEMGNLLATMAR